MVLERGSKFVLSKFIFTYYYSASSLEKRQFLLASLLYSIRITKRSAILFYFPISGNIQCYQFRCILSRAGNFYTSVQTEMKNTLTPPWKKFQIAIAIMLWSISAIRGHFAKYRPKFKIQSVRKYNSSQWFVLCVLLFLFSSFSRVFFSYYTLSPPPIQSTPLSLLVKTKGFNLFNSFFPLSFTHVKKILF